MDKFLHTTKHHQDDQMPSAMVPPEESDENEPVRKRKKLPSSVWSHFDKLPNQQHAKCRHCSKELRTSGNTSNLMEHLKRAHPLVHEGKKENVPPIGLHKYFEKTNVYSSTSEKKKKIDEAIAQMVATDMQPFSVVENAGFINLMQVVRDTHVQNMYDGMVSQLKGMLTTISSCSVTTDAWTSRGNISYLTVTCHFIINFELKSVVLATKPLTDQTNHSSANIATTFRKICDEWNIFDKVHTIVTDNAASMIKTCELLKKKHLPCFAHTLNLVVQDALALENVQGILKSTKRIVSFFKSSATAYAKFKIAQGTEKPHSLLQEVSTRWNSAYYMLQRVLLTRDPLTATLLKCQNAPIPHTENNFRIIQDLCLLLEPFDKATKHVSAAKSVTISLIIPATFALTQSLEELTEKMLTDVGSQTCEFLINNVKKRLFVYEGRSGPRLGTLLDPRLKKDGFQNPSNAQQAALALESEVYALLKDIADPVITEAPKNDKTSFLFKCVGKKIDEKHKSSRADAIITIRQYLEQSNSPEDVDPLQYWQINKESFSELSQCAVKHLCIPASSAESERTFSKAGAIVSDRRACLKPKQVNTLVFLNKNQWLLNH
ncbi:zinc finger BED domain-containing protein 4-like [Drosophila willistoni]|uniref:zinc finger BED domain-containing protein 4-like n=1 Tax=Drosophila willistoni TaxID=7260 RepID=UPI001F0761A3|nr:zinc finger BED domain-containing protein 4-like [Drosophila willistoni]